MKTVITKSLLIVAMMLSMTAKAAESSRALLFLQGQTAGLQFNTYKSFFGLTRKGKPCTLTITPRHIPGEADDVNQYYVTVGLFDSQKMTDYVGLLTNSQARLSASGNLLGFSSSQDWDNGSLSNQVTVEVNQDGQPIAARGVADRHTIYCKIAL